MNFWDRLNEADDEQLTENGAVGFKSTGSNLLNLNFIIPSLRNASQGRIMNLFIQAYRDDKILALKWLFFARDVRAGLGERRLFRLIINGLAQNNEVDMRELIQLVPEYGRFDDLLSLMNTVAENDTLRFIKGQLRLDIHGRYNKKPISLLAKWLPSRTATNKIAHRLGRRIADKIGYEYETYNDVISDLRSYLDIVERKMSNNQWGLIKYETVPSKANILYGRAFFRHDLERRAAYLESVKRGDAKINAGTLTPADIVNRYIYLCGWDTRIKPYDETLEQLWKALPDKVNGDGGSIVVCDGSGSMFDAIPKTNITALSVSNAIAIYFSERASGVYKNRFITFSRRPQLVDLSECVSLRDKLNVAIKYNEAENTNIEAVFNLILKAALESKAQQSDLPKNIIIVSDMEFDINVDKPNLRLFDSIKAKFEDAGYKLPKVAYWNVNSRTNTIPIKVNEYGVALVSGFSIHVIDMILSEQLDPYLALIDVLNSDRYKPVEAVLKRGECSEAV